MRLILLIRLPFKTDVILQNRLMTLRNCSRKSETICVCMGKSSRGGIVSRNEYKCFFHGLIIYMTQLTVSFPALLFPPSEYLLQSGQMAQ